ncbi:MAG: hypothetical protein QOC60_1742, partial [Frankiaceae bacterium]|nr:hypothetical protein [Frankiaceae bacterium]
VTAEYVSMDELQCLEIPWGTIPHVI